MFYNHISQLLVNNGEEATLGVFHGHRRPELLMIIFISLFLAVQRLRCCSGFSLVAASRGCSLAVVHGLLVAVASLVGEYGLLVSRASVIVGHGLSCSAACGIFLD